MMQHIAPVIMERINRFFGYNAVVRVTFRQGIVQSAKTKPRPSPPSLRPIPAEYGDSLLEIGDPELRACLESLARGVAESEREAFAGFASTAIPVLGKIGEAKR